jgi:hypothetical protein
MRMLPRRVCAAGRRLGSVAICALAAHAAVYGAWRPDDGVHGYFGWYEPLVLGLALAAAAVLAAALALAVLSRWRPALGRAPAALVSLLGEDRRPGAAAVRLVPWGAAWLVGQETLERSLAVGAPAPAAIDAVAWLIALAALTACSYALDLIAYWSRRLVRRALGGRGVRGAPGRAAARAAAPAAVDRRRRSPLAERRALRAPPPARA